VVRIAGDTVGVPNVVVTLHRVITADTAGAIDSLRSGPTGGFVFELPTLPDPLTQSDVYLTSVNHQGVLYFGPAVHEPAQLDSLYQLEVHDTTMVAEDVSLPPLLRYLVLELTPTDWVVTDVIQVENEGDRTLVAPAGEPVWRYPLPVGARDLQLSPELPPESLRQVDGVVEVTAPLTPGVGQFIVRYRLEQPRLDLRMAGNVSQVELMVREPAPLLAVTGLVQTEPAELEPGVLYRRFNATNLRDGRVLVLPGVPQQRFPLEWLAVMMGLLLAAVTVWAVQRPDLAAAGGAELDWLSARERQEALLLEVAEIDERLDAEGVAEKERKDLTSRRQALLDHSRRLGGS
jgi:hypothetical protein